MLPRRSVNDRITSNLLTASIPMTLVPKHFLKNSKIPMYKERHIFTTAKITQKAKGLNLSCSKHISDLPSYQKNPSEHVERCSIIAAAHLPSAAAALAAVLISFCKTSKLATIGRATNF